MLSNIFDDLESKKDSATDKALSDALENLVNNLVSDKNTNLSKREIKAISILKQNKYIWNIIKDYVPNKRYINASFNKTIQNAITQISKAIGQANLNQNDNESFLSRFWKRR